jgi:hypothetical protein
VSERVLGHVDRGVARALSFPTWHCPRTRRTWGVNLPRLSAAMRELSADAPSPYRTLRVIRRRVHAAPLTRARALAPTWPMRVTESGTDGGRDSRSLRVTALVRLWRNHGGIGYALPSSRTS